jgi:hypothetical protein
VKLRLAAAVLAAASLAGCGSGGGHGTATIWISRDRGARVLLVRDVPAGLTAMQALDRVAEIETRYAGRYVQAIDGVAGSLTARHDWFYFINGYESDRSAAEYRLHAGDIEWWDFRDWRRAMVQPVVVGAFPEPFLHGFDGKRRSSAVVYAPGLAQSAHRLARLIHAPTVVPSGTKLMKDVNLLVLERGRLAIWGQLMGSHPGDPVRFVVSGAASKLAGDPGLVRYRYDLLR